MTEWALGTVEIFVSSGKALNILAEADVHCSHIIHLEDEISFRVPAYSYFKVKGILSGNSVEYRSGKIRGLPGVILKYRKRWGFAIGMIIFFISVFISGTFIWSFEVEGNDSISDEDIISRLGELGCTYGTPISSIDFDMLHNDFLIENKEISWISVNMDGTNARVEIRELAKGAADKSSFSNIIANEDGQIYLVTVINGKRQVVIGDVVRRGDVLISGVEEYREGEVTYYCNAEGIVLATVNRSFTVSIENTEAIKKYTERYERKNTLKIFGFSVNLFLNSGIPYDKYDTIIKNRQMVLFDYVRLPVWIRTEEYREYMTDIESLSEDEMRSRAIREYKKKLADISETAELVSISTEHRCENGVYTIDCNLYCITDIAQSVPFSIENESQDNSR